MKTFENYNLREDNTFHIGAKASKFIVIEEIEDLTELFNKGIFNEKFFILGGGSNLLFTKDFDGTVIKIDLQGTTIVNETEEKMFIESYAGENWDDFVLKTIGIRAFGLENLSLIPGSVGASAVQNIGAYGVEAKDFIDSVEYFDIKDGNLKTLSNSELKFNYRDSIFKNELKDRAIISKVTFALNKVPEIKAEYADIQKMILEDNLNKEEINPERMREMIIQIRKFKLEDPKKVGNAGSFFKNPIVEEEIANQIQSKYPDLKLIYTDDNKIKIPAAWLIEQCGWKGWTSENSKYGVSSKHALILVNYDDARGEELKELAEDISTSVSKKFAITLSPEVILI